MNTKPNKNRNYIIYWLFFFLSGSVFLVDLFSNKKFSNIVSDRVDFLFPINQETINFLSPLEANIFKPRNDLVNENARLTSLPESKSFTLGYRLQTVDVNLSPRIDTLDAQVVLERSRINQPILDYVKDGRSNESSNDPHASVYISNRVDLKNPATSLKVLISKLIILAFH